MIHFYVFLFHRGNYAYNLENMNKEMAVKVKRTDDHQGLANNMQCYYFILGILCSAAFINLNTLQSLEVI